MKALSRSILPFLSFALFFIVLTGCKKDKDDNTSGNRNVKYELTGTYSGKFSIIITDNESGNLVIDNIKLPWSKEVTYNSRIIAIGIGANTTTLGLPGQTALLKIYSGGTVVKTSNATAGSGGDLSMPALAHTF